MQSKPLLMGSLERARESASSPRSLPGQIERFIGALRASVEIDSVNWEEPLRLLLSHPRPTMALRDLHSAMRAVIRRTRYDESATAHLLKALNATERRIDLVEFFEPIQLALLAFTGSVSRKPEVLMQVFWGLLPATGKDSPRRPSFRPSPRKARATVDPNLQVVNIGTQVVRRAVVLLMEECAGSATTAFAQWSDEQRLAGLEALWLAYSYCNVGTNPRRELARLELQADFVQYGAPLWRRVAAGLDAESTIDRLPTLSLAIYDLARLALSLEAKIDAHGADRSSVASTCSTKTLHVVCRSPIPESTEKYDKEEIARHRVLEEALPVVSMPPTHALDEARLRLLQEFPWASAALQVIFDDLIGRANLGASDLTVAPTLLVGLPGSGKSRLSRRLAEVFDIPRLDVCLAGNSDTKILGGTSRGWATGRPSDLASLLARRRCASAWVTLDEIDKAMDHRDGGGIGAYLLGLLELETASRHYDTFLKTECDFSKVSWICTANVLSTLAAPLRSRLRILVVPQPNRGHFPAIGECVIAELASRWGVQAGVLPELQALEIDWRGLTNVRQVRAAVEARVTAWSRALVKH